MKGLFRGIDINTGEMVTGYYAKDYPLKGDVTIIRPNASEGGEPVCTAIVEETAGMGLGKDDSFGTSIFEKDIIAAHNDRLATSKAEYIFEVRFGRCGGMQNTKEFGYEGFHVVPANEETKMAFAYGLRTDIHYWLDNYTCKVIGNVYESNFWDMKEAHFKGVKR